MGFAHCSPPLWRIDDLSQCFQQDYLAVIFPLIVIALSVLRLASSNIARLLCSRDAKGYISVSADDHAPDHTALPPDQDPQQLLNGTDINGINGINAGDGVADHHHDDHDDDLEITGGGGRLALVKTTTRGSIVQADTPTGQHSADLVETLAVAGLVALSAVALVTRAFGPAAANPVAVAGLVVWVYSLILASLRLLLGSSKWRVSHLWNHSATIYGANWLFSLFLFRSAIIHPLSTLSQTIVLLQFALVTLLFAIVLTTRRGNKTVVLEWENGIEPSREPLASLFSIATFGWVDAIVWKGWKRPLEMADVWNLLPRDKATAVIAEYRHIKKTTSLALHLLKYFKGLLLVQAAAAVVAGCFTFAPTLLLKAILGYVENPDLAPVNVLWLLVIGLPVVDTVRSYHDNVALWIGRRICIRIRAIIVGDIYAKTLRRKAAAGKDKVLGGDQVKDSKDDAPPSAKEGGGLGDKLWRALGLKKKDGNGSDNAASSSAAPSLMTGGSTNNASGDDNNSNLNDEKLGGGDEQASFGAITTLMSVDSFKVADVTAYLHFLVASAPTQLVIAIGLLWQVMGLSAIPGILVMIILLPVNYMIARGFTVTSKRIMAATDKRVNITNEILQNIRIIKYFAWERRFSVLVDEKRRAELLALRSRFIIWAIAVAVWNSVPILITFFSFLCYTLIEGKPLYPSIAFTALSLFVLLRVPLDMLGDMFAHVQEAKVSIDRIEEFLMEEETEKYKQLGLDNVDENGVRHIGFDKATLVWGGKDAVATDGSSHAFRLIDLNVDFQIGKLNIVAGPTGSGKTSLLMGLLGEMTMVSGKVYCPGGRSREDVRPDPATGLANTIAYVAQAAWLVNANIRDNILFAAPFDEQRYNDVIVACALERDLEILDHGDQTLVGEKGITLSGGQKQRISLARALYSNSAHLLLDDCLSAVDSHTAQWIFANCIKGPLMNNRTCVLVTHNVQLCVPSSDYVVLLERGQVVAQGPSKDVIASGKLGEDIQRSRPASTSHSRLPSRGPSSVDGTETVVDGSTADATAAAAAGAEEDAIVGSKKAQKSKPPPADVMDESKAVGSVKWSVMLLYFRSMGPWWFWTVAIAVFGVQQITTVLTNFWIREWSNQYIQEKSANITFSSLTSSYGGMQAFPKGTWASIARLGDNAALQPEALALTMTMTTTGSSNNPYGVNVPYYLTGLALIGVIGTLIALLRDLWLFFGSLTASKLIHDRLIQSVTRAKFKFFDVTPLGQLMNRFSKDLQAIDQDIAATAIGVMGCALALVVTVITIAFITPGFLLAAFIIAALFYGVATFYLGASRDLKRLESVQRSPLFQQFGETLSGITTIRAYGDERRFIRDNLSKINTQSRPFIYLWACNRWLAFRADILGNLVAFSAGVFIILNLGKIDPGAAGISLTYALNFTENVLWLIRQYAMNEQNMNSMERVKEYLDVEQEAEPIVEGSRPPASWPDQGAVEFVDYSTRYRAELEPVLRGISLRISPREKVGIVGRTGAGKSSLTLAIFRALEADSGMITIDGLDISKIGLQDLRENITIVPQDPTLFMGTIRTNLDPFDQYTDEQIFEALRRVQLIGHDERPGAAATAEATMDAPIIQITSDADGEEALSASTRPEAVKANKNIFLDLLSPVTESGSNLSQGQRQLLCLARAMLKKPTVLVMDEATASIDYTTDSKIQETIRELTGTVITIAHRLQTIVDYDKVLVLDKGAVLEFAHPWELINRQDGTFRSMCEMSGDFDVLLEAAKRKWEQGRLVDVEQ